MKFAEYAQKLDEIKNLVNKRDIASPNELASKLNVSERTIHRMLQHLRDHGYPITFNRTRGHYEINKPAKKNK